MELIRRLLRRMTAVSDWDLWSLPRWLTVFVLTVVAVDAVAIAVAASFTTITAHDLLLFGLLISCTALAVELSRKAGEQGGMIKDVQGVWELPVAILLPPLYALIAPIARIALMQWRVRRAPPYRRVFSCASIGLSYGAASVTFHGLSRLFPAYPGETLIHATVWTLLVTLAVLVKSVLNKAMIMTAVKATDPGATIRNEVFGREPLYNDVAEICISLLVTYGVASNPAAGTGRAARSHPAAAVAAACPVGQRLAGRFEDGPAERGDLGARGDRGGGPRGADQDPAGGGDPRHRQVQGDQRHLWSPGRRPGTEGDRPRARQLPA
jgi:hypothetical protein